MLQDRTQGKSPELKSSSYIPIQNDTCSQTGRDSLRSHSEHWENRYNVYLQWTTVWGTLWTYPEGLQIPSPSAGGVQAVSYSSLGSKIEKVRNWTNKPARPKMKNRRAISLIANELFHHYFHSASLGLLHKYILASIDLADEGRECISYFADGRKTEGKQPAQSLGRSVTDK